MWGNVSSPCWHKTVTVLLSFLEATLYCVGGSVSEQDGPPQPAHSDQDTELEVVCQELQCAVERKAEGGIHSRD